MFIEKIKIKDFACIEDIDVSFSKMNLITGDNGSGKSKFVSAIIYSLCDYLDVKILDYVRTGADKFYIENTFSHIGNNYNIKITGSSKGTDKVLTVNDKDVYKNSQAVEYIEKYIHNPKLTLASAITMQGKGSDILFEPNQKRIERLKQIFNIEKLNYVGMHLKNQIDELKIQIKELETENNVLNNTEYNYKGLPELPDENKINEYKLKKVELEKQKSDYEKNLVIYNQYVEKLNEFRTAIELKTVNEKQTKDIENSITLLETNIVSNINEDLLKEKRDLKDTIQKNISDLNKQLDVIKRHSDLLSKRESYQEKISKIEFKRRIRKPDIDLSVLKEDLIRISADIKTLESRRELVKAGKCPTCNQDYNEYGSISDFENTINELEREKHERDLHYKQSEKALVDYAEIENYNNSRQVEKDLFEEQIKDIDNSLAEFKDVGSITTVHDLISSANKDLEEVNNKIDEYEKVIKSNNETLNEIKELKHKKEICEKDFKRFSDVKEPNEVKEPANYDEDLYEIIEIKLNNLNKVKTDYDNAVEYNNMLKEMEKKNNSKVEANCKLLDDLRNKSILKDQTKKIIEKDFSGWLIDRGNQFIKKSMNDFFNKSYGKFQIDLVADGKTVDFVYTEDGENYLNVASASGFEKEIISYAFRSALNSMGNLGFMITDEIDSFSSEDNSLRLYETILQDGFEQLFSISHYPETKEYLIHSGAKIIELCNGKVK